MPVRNEKIKTIDKEKSIEDYLNQDKMFENPYISIEAYEGLANQDYAMSMDYMFFADDKNGKKLKEIIQEAFEKDFIFEGDWGSIFKTKISYGVLEL